MIVVAWNSYAFKVLHKRDRFVGWRRETSVGSFRSNASLLECTRGVGVEINVINTVGLVVVPTKKNNTLEKQPQEMHNHQPPKNHTLENSLPFQTNFDKM